MKNIKHLFKNHKTTLPSHIMQIECQNTGLESYHEQPVQQNNNFSLLTISYKFSFVLVTISRAYSCAQSCKLIDQINTSIDVKSSFKKTVWSGWQKAIWESTMSMYKHCWFSYWFLSGKLFQISWFTYWEAKCNESRESYSSL